MESGSSGAQVHENRAYFFPARGQEHAHVRKRFLLRHRSPGQICRRAPSAFTPEKLQRCKSNPHR
jgi:hypothetical protein